MLAPGKAGCRGAIAACIPFDDRVIYLRAELPPYHAAKPLAQGFGLLAELLRALHLSFGRIKSPRPALRSAAVAPVTSAAVVKIATAAAPRPNLGSRHLGHGALQGEGQLLRPVPAVVALHEVGCVLAG